MDKIESLREIKTYPAVILENHQIEYALNVFKVFILKKQKIPKIIHQNKKYETFDFKIIDTISHESPNLKKSVNNAQSLDPIDIHSDIVIDKDTENNQDSGKCFLLLTPEFFDSEFNSNFKIVNLEIILNAKFFSHTELFKKLISDDFQLSAYEIIGGIIHLNLTEEQREFKKIIADVLYFKTGNTIINKIGKIEDTYRFYKNEILAGKKTLVTTHKENGVKFRMDLGEVYWCSRLQTERNKILSMIKRNQVVCDPFCGVGPHIIPALKKGAFCLCNDLNPNAIKWLNESLELNNLSCSSVYNLDAADFLEKIKGSKIDHLIYNLPEYSVDFLKYAEFFSEYWLHVFFFSKEPSKAAEDIKNRTGYNVNPKWIRECRKVSQSKYVMKLEVYSTDFFNLQRH